MTEPQEGQSSPRAGRVGLLQDGAQPPSAATAEADLLKLRDPAGRRALADGLVRWRERPQAPQALLTHPRGRGGQRVAREGDGQPWTLSQGLQPRGRPPLGGRRARGAGPGAGRRSGEAYENDVGGGARKTEAPGPLAQAAVVCHRRGCGRPSRPVCPSRSRPSCH